MYRLLHLQVLIKLRSAKKNVEDQGGKIVNEFKLVKGFTYVHQPRGYGGSADSHASAEFPDDKVHSLSSNEHINVEKAGVVTTQ